MYKEPKNSTSCNSSTCWCISGKYGSCTNAFADDSKTITIRKSTTNTGVNVPTDTDQKQNCETAGGTSGIDRSCTASSFDQITQSGGVLKK
jgi:hypothetical protein